MLPQPRAHRNGPRAGVVCIWHLPPNEATIPKMSCRDPKRPFGSHRRAAGQGDELTHHLRPIQFADGPLLTWRGMVTHEHRNQRLPCSMCSRS